MGKVSSVLSLKHVLVLSLALNVGLISRVLYEAEPRFCFEEKQKRVSSMADSSAREAHVSKKTDDISAAGGDGGAIINLDQ